ncbi:MAG TPA: RdgB/HAM1 family non-canonical purine NTP pyrophosphatase [Burkholderiales bacterium]|nr:RdgB/HAM1 family non-canonical purine NTP pyrophosphatase [Burkholderiales bacterium]
MHKIVLASNNPGKIHEISHYLSPFGVELINQAVLGIPETGEPARTFVENALIKARNAALHSGKPALADDSGLCVDVLGGAPGVFSARFAGEPKSDSANNLKLLSLLSGRSDRQAHYYCVMVYVRHADDPAPVVVEGSWHGEIAPEPRGERGFGYDPVFYLPDYDQTAGQLDLEEKNRASHRAKALEALISRLHDEWNGH